MVSLNLRENMGLSGFKFPTNPLPGSALAVAAMHRLGNPGGEPNSRGCHGFSMALIEIDGLPIKNGDFPWL